MESEGNVPIHQSNANSGKDLRQKVPLKANFSLQKSFSHVKEEEECRKTSL